jgi:hypothetical protein
MWTTRLTQAATPPGAHDVILSRDDLTFVISLDEWWIMSASQHLANEALKEADLNFKINELYGPPRIENPQWTTDLVPNGETYEVTLLRDGMVIATFSLDEFAALSATEFVVEDAIEVAEGLAQYGDNIEEVREHFSDEFGDDEDAWTDLRPPGGPQGKPSKR